MEQFDIKKIKVLERRYNLLLYKLNKLKLEMKNEKKNKIILKIEFKKHTLKL